MADNDPGLGGKAVAEERGFKKVGRKWKQDAPRERSGSKQRIRPKAVVDGDIFGIYISGSSGEPPMILCGGRSGDMFDIPLKRGVHPVLHAPSCATVVPGHR